MSNLELVDYSGCGDYAWLRPLTPRAEDAPPETEAGEGLQMPSPASSDPLW